MSRSPSKSHSLALKAAAAIAAQDDKDEAPEHVVEPIRAEATSAFTAVEEPAAEPVAGAPSTSPEASPPTLKRGRGRPKSKREVEARHTVYLDKARHNALARIAEDRGRSVHSLILEGIDHVIGKPQNPGWQGR